MKNSVLCRLFYEYWRQARELRLRDAIFLYGPEFLLGTNNKAEDMFHTIFYANNQFSLKLAVKLIEVILNYNPKDQNIQHEMMVDGISTILQIVLSLCVLSVGNLTKSWEKIR